MIEIAVAALSDGRSAPRQAADEPILAAVARGAVAECGRIRDAAHRLARRADAAASREAAVVVRARALGIVRASRSDWQRPSHLAGGRSAIVGDLIARRGGQGLRARLDGRGREAAPRRRSNERAGELRARNACRDVWKPDRIACWIARLLLRALAARQVAARLIERRRRAASSASHDGRHNRERRERPPRPSGNGEPLATSRHCHRGGHARAL